MDMILEHTLRPWARHLRERSPLPMRLCWGNGPQQSLDLSADGRPRVDVVLRDSGAVRCLLDPSLDTLGQAYVEGQIDVNGQVTDILELAHRLSESRPDRPGWLAGLRHRVAHLHTPASDRAAIAHHYDVSNAFYAEWLDPAMVYSCAYFETGTETLAEAQTKKIDHILTKIRLEPGQRLLDIGCGWGALVLRAAQRFGARCVGITLSEQQHALATERVRDAGLQDRIEIRLQDYREVADPPFDRITSVGMFEHVGLSHLAAYFAQIRRLLAPGGWAMNHGITSTDWRDGETAKGGGRFIDRYVFPNGELPHIGTVLQRLQEGGLEAFDVENLRRHYAHTLRAWSQAYEARSEHLRTLVDERTWRIWRVYLAGCARAFEADEIALYQVLCRPAGGSAEGLPWSRRWMYG